MTAPAEISLTTAARKQAVKHASSIARQAQRTVAAAATPVKPNPKTGAWALRSRKAWQDDAYAYARQCPELIFAATFVRNATSKVHLVPGVSIDPDTPPSPIDADDSPLSAVEQEQVRVELGRIRSKHGGQARIISRLAVQQFLVGESYLVGKPAVVEENAGLGIAVEPVVESWDVLSVREIEAKGKTLVEKGGAADGSDLILAGPEGSGALGAVIIRVHEEDFSERHEAMSSVQGVLDAMEELAILSRAIRATGKSRIAQSSIVGIPHEISMPPIDPDTGEMGVPPLVEELMEHFINPIGDEGSASAAAPFIITGPADALRAMKDSVITLERPMDGVMAAQRQELRQTIAVGLDLPVEIITGLASSNHWSAWLIDEATFKAHLEPRIVAICDALTVGLLRVALITGHGWTEDRAALVSVWYDASRLVAKPNRENAANDAHDRLVISDQAYAEARGFTTDDMPDEDEIVRRIAAKRSQFDGALSEPFLRTLMPDLTVQRIVPPGQAVTTSDADGLTILEGDGDAGVTPPGTAVTVPTENAPGTSVPTEGPPPEPVTAAASPRKRNRGPALSRRLLDIDRDLRARLEEACDLALNAALVKAGNRLANLAGKGGQETRALAASVGRDRLAATLGPAVVAALGATDEELLADAFEDIAARFDRMTATAQAAVVQEIAGELSLTVEQVEAFVARQAEARGLATVVLTAGLLGLAKERLYAPDMPLPTSGEGAGVSVPVDLVRRAVTVAGGGPAGVASQVQTAEVEVRGGIGIGADVYDIMSRSGARQDEYEWIYGVTRAGKRFEPHVNLTGVRFGNFDDAVLVNTASWPPVSHLTPGDHAGCSCDAFPVWMMADDDQFNPTSSDRPADVDEANAREAARRAA